jgi:mono/diheme cytochrome c family protein
MTETFLSGIRGENAKIHRKTSHDRFPLTFTFYAIVVLLATARTAAPAQSTKSGVGQPAAGGKQLFLSVGCAGCHGESAQGGKAPRIAPSPFPLQEFIRFVRQPPSEMAPVSIQQASDAQLAEIYGYLGSLATSDAATSAPNLTGDADNGKRLFVKDGCYECHGIEGQGANGFGPRLAPNPISLPALMSYIRKPTGNMPPYAAKIVSDQDASDIHAYLKARLRPVGLESIPTFTK